jgi:hypothetical protein
MKLSRKSPLNMMSKKMTPTVGSSRSRGSSKKAIPVSVATPMPHRKCRGSYPRLMAQSASHCGWLKGY